MTALARTFVALLIATALAACTTAHSIGPVSPANIQSRVQAGDKVWVRSRDGATREFRVTRVDGQGGLHGEDIELRSDEIRELRIVELSVAKTAGLSLAIAVVATMAFASYVFGHAMDDALREETTRPSNNENQNQNQGGPLL